MTDREMEIVKRFLVIVGYSETWCKDVEAFEEACKLVGLSYRPGVGMFEVKLERVPNPLE